MTGRASTVPGEPEERRTGPEESPGGSDLAGWERGVSVAFGGLLALRGLRRRTVAGTIAALTGGWLLARGLTGRSRPLRAFETPGRGRSDALSADAETAAATETSIARTVTVRRPAADLADLWRDPAQVDAVVGDLVEVSPVDDDRWRFSVRGPLGWTPTWETRLVEDRPGEVIRWTSLDGVLVPVEGSVRFRPAPGDRGTEVTLAVRFDPPGGAIGRAALSRLNRVPRTLVGRALRRFRSLAETGEIPTLERNPSARGSGDLL